MTAVCVGLSGLRPLLDGDGVELSLLLRLQAPGEPTASELVGGWICTSVREAVVADAVGAVVTVPFLHTAPQVTRLALGHLVRVSEEGHRFGMPVVARVAVLRPAGPGGYVAESDAHLWAQAVESALDLGADAVLVVGAEQDVWPTVVRAAAGSPVLVEAGLQGLGAAAAAGAAGVVLRETF
ncbi:MAG: hypothetical protein RMM30_03840 [Armatimonadota bacterium]|nr:hypothetical protein [Armatimonadota bacterium]MDW8155700.1 hypothetical protein [Armatimonadota bacterium]